MSQILEHTLDYFKKVNPNFKIQQQGKFSLFDCPVCKASLKANFIPHTKVVHCHQCNKTIGDLLEIVRNTVPQLAYSDNSEIEEHIGTLLGLPKTKKKLISEFFDYCVKQGFDMVKVVRNGKACFELEWTIKSYKTKEEWLSWLNLDLNLGVKTGLSSNVTVLDVDANDIPEPLLKHLKDYKGLRQKTKRGHHFFFKYVAELPKTGIKIGECKVDIENNGGQVVIYPSKVEDFERQIVQMEDVPVMPEELKKYLLGLVGTVESKKPIEAEFDKDLANINVNLGQIGEGNRNNFLTHFGGILRKQLNLEQTRSILELVNHKFIKPSLSSSELNTIVNSLNKYVKFEAKDLAEKVLSYLKTVGSATARDVKEVVNEPKELVDKTLAYLIKEGYILKGKRGEFNIIKKANWSEKFPVLENSVNFKVPYFSNIAKFNYGDLILVASQTKYGKTTISMNMLKRFVEQGIKPYYISLESGSRFISTASKLGLKEGDFYWAFEADPTKIELEKNAVTIIDWLMIEDKSVTDSIMKYFVEQLFKSNGLLIIFMQLKEDGGWFAPNMTKQFPALAARYFYENNQDGTRGFWEVDAIRDPKVKMKNTKIPCEYNWDTREHLTIDELQEKNKQKPNSGVI